MQRNKRRCYYLQICPNDDGTFEVTSDTPLDEEPKRQIPGSHLPIGADVEIPVWKSQKLTEPSQVYEKPAIVSVPETSSSAMSSGNTFTHQVEVPEVWSGPDGTVVYITEDTPTKEGGTDNPTEDWLMPLFPGALDVPKLGEGIGNNTVAKKVVSNVVDNAVSNVKSIINAGSVSPKASIAGDFDPKYYTTGPIQTYPSLVSQNNDTKLKPHLDADGKTTVKYNVKNAASNALTVPTKLGLVEGGLDIANYLYENRENIDDAVSVGQALYDYGKSVVPSMVEWVGDVVDNIKVADPVGLIRNAVDVTPVPTILNTMDNVVEVITGNNPHTASVLHDALDKESAVELFTDPIDWNKGGTNSITVDWVESDEKDTLFTKAANTVKSVGDTLGNAVGTAIDTGAQVVGGAIDAIGGWVDSWKWW